MGFCHQTRTSTRDRAPNNPIHQPITTHSAALADGPGKYPELVKLRQDVINFAKTFPTVGF